MGDLCCVGSKSSIMGDIQDFLSGKMESGKRLDQLTGIGGITFSTLHIPLREATHTPILRVCFHSRGSWAVVLGTAATPNPSRPIKHLRDTDFW